MKIKVLNTTKTQLDWLVLQSNGAFDLHLHSTYGTKKAWVFSERDDEDPERVDNHFLIDYSASTDWSQGGPIIERECIQVCPDKYSGTWVAFMTNNGEPFEFRAATPLIAAMRCFVASKLGNEVEIPKELE